MMLGKACFFFFCRSSLGVFFFEMKFFRVVTGFGIGRLGGGGG